MRQLEAPNRLNLPRASFFISSDIDPYHGGKISRTPAPLFGYLL